MPLLLQHLFPLALLKVCVKETQTQHASLCTDSKADTPCPAETTELYYKVVSYITSYEGKDNKLKSQPCLCRHAFSAASL